MFVSYYLLQQSMSSKISLSFAVVLSMSSLTVHQATLSSRQLPLGTCDLRKAQQNLNVSSPKTTIATPIGIIEF